MSLRAIQHRLAPALLALALSGFAALVYQVCWMRLAALAFGSTVYATSTVLAVFFAGLAVGGELGGRASARLAHPLRLFACLEALLAVLGALSPVAFMLADGAYAGVYGALRDAPAALALARLGIVTALVLVPASLMGASLPLFMRAAAAALDDAGTSVSRLYAANTLGALAGCALAGFVLIPGIGIQRCVLLAAAANTLAAMIAFNLASAAPPAHVSAGAALPRARLLGAIVLVAGAVALANEVLWTRYLGLILHNSVLTYTLALAVVLAGIVIGSAVAPALLRASTSPATTLGTLQVANGLLVLSTSLLPPGAWAVGSQVATCAMLLLPTAVVSGASFPIAVQILLPESRAAGAGVGRLYALNTLGGIVGALGAGFLLLPLAGLQASLLVSSGASIAAGIVAFVGLGARRRTHAIAAGVAAAGLWIALPALAGTRVPSDFLAAGRELVGVREGVSANVAVVREQGELQLEIDRWWQGSTRKGHQIVAAHVPMLLHPDPRRVLVIGAGAGQTPSRVLMYPVENLDVVDIEPAVFDVLERYFDAAWMHDPRVRLLRDDGRNFVVHGNERYDVVAIEVGQISRPGVASFYTREFYAHARERLEPGGLLVQFVPLPFFTLPEFETVVRTFLDVFPASVLWYNTAELLLIGRNGEGFSVDSRRLLEAAGNAEVDADLRYSQWGAPGRLSHCPGPPGRAARGLPRGAAGPRADRWIRRQLPRRSAGPRVRDGGGERGTLRRRADYGAAARPSRISLRRARRRARRKDRAGSGGSARHEPGRHRRGGGAAACARRAVAR